MAAFYQMICGLSVNNREFAFDFLDFQVKLEKKDYSSTKKLFFSRSSPAPLCSFSTQRLRPQAQGVQTSQRPKTPLQPTI